MSVQYSLYGTKSRKSVSLLSIIVSVCFIQLCLCSTNNLFKRKKDVFLKESDLIHRNPHKHLTNFGN